MTADLRPPFGPASRLLLGIRDSKLHRCSWCGDWRWDRNACVTCSVIAVSHERSA